MVTLLCVVVGVEGSAFPVDIDVGESVEKLKQAIAKKYDLAATNLQVYVAKNTKEDTWLPWRSDLSVVAMQHGAIPDDIQEMMVQEMNEADKIGDLFTPCRTQNAIHVLVKIPTKVDARVPLRVPVGPKVDLLSCDHLLAFMEEEMTNKDAIVSRSHILAHQHRAFRLVGRAHAMDTVSKCFKDMITHAKRTATDRNQVPIPVCYGPPGLGQTRMLEESGTISERIKLDPDHVVRVIVPYGNGFRPQSVERSMPIEASFSWRLLYRFFLDTNCDRALDEWFKARLPRNGAQLSLRRAVRIIERKLRGKHEKTARERAPFYLVLGIDDYQTIDEIGAQRKDPDTSLVRELVETIGDLLCIQSSSLIVLPMFAGTDLGVIERNAMANDSSHYVLERLPMDLLSMDQVFSTVESNACYARLLSHAHIRRDLFALGGVPRWIVEYLTAVKNSCAQGEPVTVDNTDKCFAAVWTKSVASYLGSWTNPQLVRLAAFAVSGKTVDPQDTFDGNLTWSKLRDSSLCLLIPRRSSKCGAHDVRVPYALLATIGSRREQLETGEERDFARALDDMAKMVDSTMFDRPPWALWEIFGACFYAVRINALLALGYTTVTLGALLSGTRMSNETSSLSVKLVPSRVIRCVGAFGASTPRLIPRKGNRLENPIDWTAGGVIVVTEDDGAGVDIFFALKDAMTGSVVVVVDQRRRPCQPSPASEYLGGCPDFLVARCACLVRGVMHGMSSSTLATYVVPDGCFLLSRAEPEQFYGTLAYHPACAASHL